MSEPVRRRRRSDRYQTGQPEALIYARPMTEASVAEGMPEETAAAAEVPAAGAVRAPRIRPEAELLPEPEPADIPDVPAGSGEAPIPQPRDVLATNTGVRLACTMAAMMGLFALFLCWAEQESRVIRRFSVQSAALTAMHAALGLTALVLSWLLGGIPFFGLMVKLLCLLSYIAGLILLLITRVRLMQHAWQGVRFLPPLPLERIIRRYY